MRPVKSNKVRKKMNINIGSNKLRVYNNIYLNIHIKRA